MSDFEPSRRKESKRFPWLASYPPGVSQTAELCEYGSLGDLIEQSTTRFAEKTAFINMGKAATYRDIGRYSNAFAAYLQGELRLSVGARVALMVPNTLQYPIALFGALRAGYVVVNCNPLYTPRELEHQLKDSGAEAIVIVENYASVLEQIIHKTDVKHVIVTKLGDMLGFPKGMVLDVVVRLVKRMVPAWDIPNAISFKSVLQKGKKLKLRPVDVGHEDLALLQYTGGTSGVPKGAMLTHGNMLANLQQIRAWIKPFVREGKETVITILPLYHIFALMGNCLTHLAIGATNVLITNPRDITRLIREMSIHPFTTIIGVNTLFNALLSNAEFAKLDFSDLRICIGGGMALHKSVTDEWKHVTGRPLLEAYGLTEASPAVTFNPLNLEEATGSIGVPLPSTEIAIRDDEGQDLPIGGVGELCVRGPQVMKGYWNRPKETAEALMSDGFLRTGDVAQMDDQGFLRIVDRKKDMILVSGFNVYPNEIEQIVGAHPGVLEVGAVGVPDAKTGEAIKIVVVRRDPKLTAEKVIAFCHMNLTGYKVPHHVEFRDELPKTNVGKVLRRVL